jgi:hypothetical protein
MGTKLWILKGRSVNLTLIERDKDWRLSNIGDGDGEGSRKMRRREGRYRR